MRGRHPYICHTSYNKKNITGYILLFLLRHLCIKLKGQSYYTHQASICKSENSGILLVNVYGIYISSLGIWSKFFFYFFWSKIFMCLYNLNRKIKQILWERCLVKSTSRTFFFHLVCYLVLLSAGERMSLSLLHAE